MGHLQEVQILFTEYFQEVKTSAASVAFLATRSATAQRNPSYFATTGFGTLSTIANPSATHRARYGLVWFGLVWFGSVWFGLVCFVTLIARTEADVSQTTSACAERYVF